MNVAEYLALRERGLKLTAPYIPGKPFRFEKGVALGRCEIQPGVRFGLYSYMNSGFVRSGVHVGRYCSIGRDVTIGTGHHEMDALSTSSFFKQFSRPSSLKLANEVLRARVMIGNDVWIGDRAIILSGVTVGDGAVIAAGSVVNRSVAPYSIVGGVPARVIRARFAPEVVERLLAVRWWEFDPAQLAQLTLGEIEQTLAVLESWPAQWRTKIKDEHEVL